MSFINQNKVDQFYAHVSDLFAGADSHISEAELQTELSEWRDLLLSHLKGDATPLTEAVRNVVAGAIEEMQRSPPSGWASTINLTISTLSGMQSSESSDKDSRAIAVAEFAKLTMPTTKSTISAPQVEAVSPSRTPATLQPAQASNFRTIPFNIDGEQIYISGLARPGSYTYKRALPQTEEVMELSALGWSEEMIWRKLVIDDLKSRNIDILISLSEKNVSGEQGIKFLWEGEDSDHEHYVFDVLDLFDAVDYKAASPEQVDQLVAIVRSAAKSHKNVAIHCGEGWGRTGSILANLALRFMIDEEKKKPDSPYWKTPPKPTQTLVAGKFVHEEGISGLVRAEVTVSPLVAAAIKKVRDFDPPRPPGGLKSPAAADIPIVTKGHSVEEVIQVEELADLELLLWNEFTKSSNQGTTPENPKA